MIILNEANENLTATDRILAQKINLNPELFLGVTVKEFGNLVNSAVSTISKFVRRIGFENYRSFQEYLNKCCTLLKEAKYLEPINVNDKDVFVLKDSDFLVINETVKKIDFDIFEEFVVAIAEAKKIWVIGEGNSCLAARDLANALNNIGLTAFSTNTIVGKMHQLNHLVQNDVLIFVSEQFSHKEYQDFILQLKKQKVKIGLITSINKFFISQKIDFVINFFSFPQQKRPNIIGNVKIQQIFINNLLINAIIKKKDLVIEWSESMKW